MVRSDSKELERTFSFGTGANYVRTYLIAQNYRVQSASPTLKIKLFSRLNNNTLLSCMAYRPVGVPGGVASVTLDIITVQKDIF